MSAHCNTEAMRLLLLRLSAHSVLDSEEERAVLALPAIEKAVRAHIDFVRPGEILEHSCLVVDGLVARFEQLDDGERQIVSLHIPGDLVDLNSLLMTTAPSPLQALSPSSIVRIPHTALRDLVARYPNIATAFWRDTVVDAMSMAQAVVRIGRRDGFGRTAHLLCEMAVRYDCIGAVRNGHFLFPITQTQLADTLGLTSVHVNRMLRALRDSRLVSIASGRVEIMDMVGLRRAAGFDEAYLSARRAA